MMNTELRWSLQAFSDLSIYELYAILALRSEVFVVEQVCVYHDPDGFDQSGLHLCAWDGPTLVAYARILPAQTKMAHVSLGRVIVRESQRGLGIGKELVERGLAAAQDQFGVSPVAISAQCHLTKLYEDVGFVVQGEAYEEDGIPHVGMLFVRDAGARRRLTT